jgi:hypothetical protein
VKHSDIVARTQTVWGVRNVPYSMSKTNTPTGHRADCSGYVSAVLGLPAPGENTVTLVTKGICVPISKSEMIPGDLLMIGGPGTAGAAGHVAVFVGRGRGGCEVWEQSGSQWGPHHSVWGEETVAQYMAYRFKDVEMPLGDRYLRQGNTGGDVRDLQQLLLSLGYDLGPDGADGDFGPVTDRAVRAFQRAHSLEVDGIVGPLTLAALREATASQVPAVPAPEEPVSGPSEEFEPNVILKKLDLLLAQQAELLGRPPVTAHVDIPSLAEAIAGYLVDTPLTMADVEMALRRVLLEGVGQ